MDGNIHTCDFQNFRDTNKRTECSLNRQIRGGDWCAGCTFRRLAEPLEYATGGPDPLPSNLRVGGRRSATRRESHRRGLRGVPAKQPTDPAGGRMAVGQGAGCRPPRRCHRAKCFSTTLAWEGYAPSCRRCAIASLGRKGRRAGPATVPEWDGWMRGGEGRSSFFFWGGMSRTCVQWIENRKLWRSIGH